MRRIVIALAAAALIVASLGTSALASNDPCAGADVCLPVTFPMTYPSGPGRMWTDGGGGNHGRDIPVSADISDASGVVGHLLYSFNFNASPDFSSSDAWCSFSIDFNSYGTYQGHCSGTLVAGNLDGSAGGGSTLKGTYTLQPGGALGLGPYTLVLGLFIR